MFIQFVHSPGREVAKRWSLPRRTTRYASGTSWQENVITDLGTYLVKTYNKITKFDESKCFFPLIVALCLCRWLLFFDCNFILFLMDKKEDLGTSDLWFQSCHLAFFETVCLLVLSLPISWMTRKIVCFKAWFGKIWAKFIVHVLFYCLLFLAYVDLIKYFTIHLFFLL